jgi:hypothetical protein
MIEKVDPPGIRKQYQPLNISRAGYNYEPVPETPENLALMKRLDQLWA